MRKPQSVGATGSKPSLDGLSGTDYSQYLTDPFLTPATLAANLWSSGADRWVPKPHLLYASQKITHSIMKGNGRLIISMPPRHGKSRLVSEATIPWFLEKFPGKNMMFVAYNSAFAEEWGMKAKDIIKARADLFSYGIRSDRDRVDRFETTNGSVCWFDGINGGQTGKGAHFVVIDDYIKDIEDAMSKGMRDKTWMKFVANIYTRLEPGATIVIVATRWWSDDLIGRILKNLQGDEIPWENICFPGVYKPTHMLNGQVVPDLAARDALGRRYGDVLFPERYPLTRFNELQRAMNVSSTIFEALVQQTPVDDQTTFTDGTWVKVVHGMNPSMCDCVRSWDFASKQGGGDWTTGLKMGRKGMMRQAYIFNIIRKQISPLKIEELIRRTAVADGTECVVVLEQEPGSQGAQLIEHYRVNVLPEFRVIGVPAGNKSKVLKAQPLIAAVESGNVFCVEDGRGEEEADWIKEFREEFAAFPPSTGGHDDQVDTASMSYNHLFEGERVDPSWGHNALMHNGRVTFGFGKPDPEKLAELDSVYAGEDVGSRLVTGVVW